MSDTVKLIVDIPVRILDTIQADEMISREQLAILQTHIQNGIPLNDVKAEIEKQIERDFAFSETETLKVPCHYGIANGLQNAIRFLDNIGKAESEDT